MSAGDKLLYLSFIKHIALLDEMCDEADLAEQDFDEADVGHSGFGAVVRQDNHYVAAIAAFGGQACYDQTEVVDVCDYRFFAVVDFGAEFFDVAVGDAQFCKSFGVARPAVAIFADDYHHWPFFGQQIEYLACNLFV